MSASAAAPRVEDQLDVLPVALVQVVPVVVRIEDPVLQRELAGVAGVGGHVGVDGRVVACGEPARPALVVASGIQGVPREIEVVLVETGEVVRRRADLHEVGGTPRPSERDGRLAEQELDVHRLVGLARAALLGLLDESHDGCIPLRKLGLVRKACTGRRHECEHDRREQDEKRRARHDRAHAADHGACREQPAADTGPSATGFAALGVVRRRIWCYGATIAQIAKASTCQLTAVALISYAVARQLDALVG